MRKTIKHKMYSIEEKNAIVQLYLSGEKKQIELVREYDISHRMILVKWAKMFKEFGTVVDRRGKGTKPGNRKGRPKKLKVEEMSHEELVHYVRLHEDIKKSIAYLRKRKTNTK
jgi:transposase